MGAGGLAMGSAIVIGVGASAGLGAALCRRFAREGLHVLPAGRTREKLDLVVEEIRAAGGSATAVVCDTTRTSDVERVFDTAEDQAGIPELVVYNAGNNQFRPLLEMDDAFFEELWRLCCFGGFLTGREAAKRMLPNGGGTLIFTGATASVRARPPFTAFASAKAALRAVAHGMARKFGKEGLHVGHVVVDGVIGGDLIRVKVPQIVERLGEDGMLDIDAMTDAYWMLHQQQRSAWTLELDLRPHKESF
jgi:NAD(P)-dependent dehydrogenase (short-subunit alcohol dehydrogenase family)